MDPLSKHITDAVRKARPIVVHVRAVEEDGDAVTLGSGVILDANHVVTSAQVVSGDEKEILVSTVHGSQYRASVLGVDPLYFLTFLEIDGWLPVEPLNMLPASEVEPGQAVVAIGSALGHDHSVTYGVVTAVDRTVYRPERLPVDGLVITDATVHPGNVSGALVRLDGALVGVNGIPWQHGLSLAVHADVVQRLAHQMLDYGQATHPWLGFTGEPQMIEPAVVDLFSLEFDRGVSVKRVAGRGPADQAGLQIHDLVVRVKEQPVNSLGSIRRTLALHRHGDRVPLTVLRSGDLVNLEMRVDEMPRLRRRRPRRGDGGQGRDKGRSGQ